MNPSTLKRVADLYVEVGANVQPGQILVARDRGREGVLTRAVAESAYRHGAKFVDVQIFDPWIKRTRIQYAEEDTLGSSRTGTGSGCSSSAASARAHPARRRGGAADCSMTSTRPRRARHAPALKESRTVVSERTVNWTIGPAPTVAWAQSSPRARGRGALARLWDEVVHVCGGRARPDRRLGARQDELVAVAERLAAQRFDAHPLPRPGDRPDASACCRPRPGSPRASRPSTGSRTRRTSPPRRSSPRPTPSGSKARDRDPAAGARRHACEASRCASRAAAR